MARGSWKFIAAAFVQFLLHLCYSQQASFYTFMEEATSAPTIVHYDYIIIGGGTSGCPLGATLSETSLVLVLERGGSPYGNPNITNISSFAATLSDDSPTSPSQRFVSEDGVINARARVLGGGSALNAGFYSRASPSYVNEAGWDGKLVNQSYEWVEKKVVFEPPMLQWQSAVRDGLLEVGVQPYNGFTYDHINGTKVGGTIFDHDGHRHTAADLLQYADPSRIRVYLHATVQRIVFRVEGNAKPRAYGVIFKDASGVTHTAYLNDEPQNEIILSAGALGSPQLLMLSGIGPVDQLRAHGIDVVIDQPMVGQGMSDNPMNALIVPSPTPVEISLIQVVGIMESGIYIETSSGSGFNYALAGMIHRAIDMLTSEAGLPLLPIEPPSSLDNAAIRAGVILEKIMGPISTGYLELRSTDPDENPAVTFNYFEDPEDLRKCVEGMTTIINVIQSNSFSEFRYPALPVHALINTMMSLPVNLRDRHITGSFSLEQFCIDTVMTIWHYHGGCQVDRVVDRDYKVLGVDALRVIDGSTFNYSPGTNPQATVMMLGRYMGQRILHERLEGMKQ